MEHELPLPNALRQLSIEYMMLEDLVAYTIPLTHRRLTTIVQNTLGTEFVNAVYNHLYNLIMSQVGNKMTEEQSDGLTALLLLGRLPPLPFLLVTRWVQKFPMKQPQFRGIVYPILIPYIEGLTEEQRLILMELSSEESVLTQENSQLELLYQLVGPDMSIILLL